MERELHPRKWPHFMEKKYKPAKDIYHSKKVLGQLYDMVERVAFIPEWTAPFDSRVLDAYRLEEVLLEKARNLKGQYDESIKRLMAQHAIRTEFEVWSAFVLDHNQEKKDYSIAEELGQLALAVKNRFRKDSIEAAGEGGTRVRTDQACRWTQSSGPEAATWRNASHVFPLDI
jgi:RNA-dependent RNA polymerase